ncbi:MAG: hypothetical protein HOH82_25880, partial [Planctomycetaceae bacterium]|nr:hypothetical protein [Planctomycetaceae bacterium]
MKQLHDALERGHVILDLDATDIGTAVGRTVGHMVLDGIIPQQAAEQIVSALLQREQAVPLHAAPVAAAEEVERAVERILGVVQ